MAMSAWRGAGLRSLLGGGGAAAAAVGKGASRRMSAAAASVHVEQHAAAAAPAAPRKGVREVRSANGVTAEVRNVSSAWKNAYPSSAAATYLRPSTRARQPGLDERGN
jgi:hypothetical protein